MTMRVVRPLTSVLDAIYAPVPDTRAWLHGIRGVAAEAFTGPFDVQAYEGRLGPDGITLGAIACQPGLAPLLRRSHRLAPDAAAVIEDRFRAGVAHAAVAMPRHPARHLAVQAGVADVFVAMGFPDPTRICALSAAFDRHQPRMPREVRKALERIAAHLGAASRMRPARRRDEEGDAVLAPGGAVLHAEGSAQDSRVRSRLRDAALGVIRARREAAQDPAASLAFWTAMVDGRWTLVERFDSDGKRFLVAKRNAPHGVAHAALDPRERAVIERAALGGSLRHIAYELGLAESTVSQTLTRALAKVRIRSRAELMELRAALFSAKD